MPTSKGCLRPEVTVHAVGRCRGLPRPACDQVAVPGGSCGCSHSAVPVTRLSVCGRCHHLSSWLLGCLSVATRLPRVPRSPEREAWEAGWELESWVRDSTQSSLATSPASFVRSPLPRSWVSRVTAALAAPNPPEQGLQRETPGSRPFRPFHVPEPPWPVHKVLRPVYTSGGGWPPESPQAPEGSPFTSQ